MEDQQTPSVVQPLPVLSSSPFLSLSTELKQAILSALPDTSTLQSLALTCSTFYHTIRNAESRIIESILHRQIGSDLLSDALIVLEARMLATDNEEAVTHLLDTYAEESRMLAIDNQEPETHFLDTYDAQSRILEIDYEKVVNHFLDTYAKPSRMLAIDNKEAVTHFLDSYAERAPTITSDHQGWRLRPAVAISSLHNTIESLSEDFARLALGKDIVTGLDEPSHAPLSASESNRIKRAFYRYELFNCVFRGHEGFGLSECASVELPQHFFFMYNPWENEQIRCVRDYLFDRLRIAYNDVAEHDVEWAKLGMRFIEELWTYEDQPIHGWMEFHLSLGLSRLHQILNASTFEERCQLLKPLKNEPRHSHFDALQDIRFGQELLELERDQMDPDIDTSVTQSAMDTDMGPEEAWRWGTIANGDERPSAPEGQLRKRGYVMWDSARLAAWGLFDHDPFNVPYDEHMDPSERARRTVEIINSFDARREIWDRGGRGWWSSGDESRVVWPPHSQAT